MILSVAVSLSSITLQILSSFIAIRWSGTSLGMPDVVNDLVHPLGLGVIILDVDVECEVLVM